MPVWISNTQDCLGFLDWIGVPLNGSVLLMTLLLFLAGFCSKFPSSFSRGYHEKALSLPLSKNGQPILVFPVYPAPDHSPGSLCWYAKGRPSSYTNYNSFINKQMNSAQPGFTKVIHIFENLSVGRHVLMHSLSCAQMPTYSQSMYNFITLTSCKPILKPNLIITLTYFLPHKQDGAEFRQSMIIFKKEAKKVAVCEELFGMTGVSYSRNKTQRYTDTPNQVRAC